MAKAAETAKAAEAVTDMLQKEDRYVEVRKKKVARRPKKENTQDMLDIGSLLAKQKERER